MTLYGFRKVIHFLPSIRSRLLECKIVVKRATNLSDLPSSFKIQILFQPLKLFNKYCCMFYAVHVSQ